MRKMVKDKISRRYRMNERIGIAAKTPEAKRDNIVSRARKIDFLPGRTGSG
ncbi:MAG: hypothetical protein M5U10_00580 [Candidatus Methanoperedens sp.]|nr:hypothetical protein [Candidatus Methanoperedens sp.]